MDIVTGSASTTVSAVIARLVQHIDEAIELEENHKVLEGQLNRMKVLLGDISDQFEHQQQKPPQSLRNCLKRMEEAVVEAKELIDRSKQPQPCLDFIFCKSKLSRQIKEYREALNELFEELHTDFSVFCNAQWIASTQ